MNQTPKISVIVPVYNVEDHIERCLISLDNQGTKDFEVIFVDDRGSDSSIDIVSKYITDDKSLKIIHNSKNLGTYHARRVGVEKALGKYIIFLDPDDELDKNFISILTKSLQHDVDIIFYGVKYIPKRKFYQAKPPSLPFYQKKGNIIEAIQLKNGKKLIAAGTAGKAYNKNFLKKMYRKLSIDENYRYIYTEDQLLYYSALLEHPKYFSLDYDGYVYYRNDTSITHQNKLSNPNIIVGQMRFTIDKLKGLIAEMNLTKNEKKFFDFLLTKDLPSQISLRKRFENNRAQYLFHVWNAFKYVPRIQQLIRIIIYLFSFKKIKI